MPKPISWLRQYPSFARFSYHPRAVLDLVLESQQRPNRSWFSARSMIREFLCWLSQLPPHQHRYAHRALFILSNLTSTYSTSSDYSGTTIHYSLFIITTCFLWAIAKGVTVKESEISRGLVSPAQRALKKICTLAQFWPEKSGIRPTPKMGD